VVIALSVNTYTPAEKGGSWNPNDHLADIKAWQVWRLVTPIFLHFGAMHLVMNMFAFYYFGNFIESRRGPIMMGVLVLLIAIFSTAMQYQFDADQSPVFGGMSGVIFGLFGYLWAKTLLDPTAGMNLQPSTIFMMMFWFVLCFTGVGIFSNIANIAHAAGLVGGGFLGVVSTFAKEAPRSGK
jgi:GlpG protein